ncbi:MAG: hypothetical protein EA341_14020 [Mongoliibacter sp.]|uniref:hypothetical protein n=1 Tax=Mongoliibacter sp. TaxID=2022438 RepID=UPI0012F166BF|nr:hypothetical protein [Mongoliibacter sp.]TVP46208.1 MAG: hypothetical protein EA341_14020 [Mongoliibacter sp.]
MKINTSAKWSTTLWALALLVFVSSCSQFDSDEFSNLETNEAAQIQNGFNMSAVQPGVTSFIWEVLRGPANGGNLSCSDLGDFERSTGRNNIEDGAFVNPWPSELEVSLVDGKFVTWNFVGTIPSGYCLEMSVIVKGGANHNVFTYEAGITSGSGIAAPEVGGKNKNTPDVSNLTFCWNFVPCEDDDTDLDEECEGKEQTAYAGVAGAGSAWWFYIDTESDKTEFPIYAGQKLTDGTVTVVNDKITINLGSWSLQDDDEAVKVLGYNTLPASRPASGGGPGSPRIYAGTELEINGNGSRYYVVHLDAFGCVFLENED